MVSTTLSFIIESFHQVFEKNYQVRLIGGFDEPLYLPAKKNQKAEIRFKEDFPSSALHEISHWCIAGKSRREKVDYGYWYYPDGRTPKQQLLFSEVEKSPQALEMAFSHLIKLPFHISQDNLSMEEPNEHFPKLVKRQYLDYLEHKFPSRAFIYMQYLANAVLGIRNDTDLKVYLRNALLEK